MKSVLLKLALVGFVLGGVAYTTARLYLPPVAGNTASLSKPQPPPDSGISTPPMGENTPDASVDAQPTIQTFPKGSIGDLATQLNDLLQQPEARRINQVPTPPYIAPGIEIHGPTFTDSDRFQIRVNDDGATVSYRQFHCEQMQGSSQVDKHLYVELPKLDPASFKSITYQHWPSITEGLPENHLVVIESDDQLNANLYWPSTHPAILPRFGFGFVHLDDAQAVIKLLNAMKERALFERKVRDDLPTYTTFTDRASLYGRIDQQLRDQGTGIGFFGAASSVTSAFSLQFTLYDASATMIGPDMADETRQFMNNLSIGLAGLNSKEALELLRFGRLTASDGTIAHEPEAIDAALVHAEQQFAEIQLSALTPTDRQKVVSDSNHAISVLLSYGPTVGNSMAEAATQALTAKRSATGDQNATLDYGSLDDRVQIGLQATRIARDQK